MNKTPSRTPALIDDPRQRKTIPKAKLGVDNASSGRLISLPLWFHFGYYRSKVLVCENLLLLT